MDYDFLNMGNQQFENLTQSLMQRLLGHNSIIFGAGSDGGRELTYEGKSNFPNIKNSWSGYWVVQAKYKSREDSYTDSFKWVKRNLSKEINGFIDKKRRLPDNYIFITNAVLTAVENKGGRDKIQEYLKIFSSVISNILIISYDELCKIIDNNLDVRSAYSHLITPGDVLFSSLKATNRTEINTVLENKELRELQSPTKRNYTFLTNEVSKKLVSIDFGSSYSLIAYINDKNETCFIKSDKQQILIPTCITFFDNDTYIVGKPEYKKIKDAITISNFKRELGRNKEYIIFKEKLTAEYLSELFLKSLRQNIIDYFESIADHIVISKPTYFTIKQTNALLQAFHNSGFVVTRVFSESSVATLNYNFLANDRDCDDCHLTIDFGGGTLDINVVIFEYGVYEIKNSYGNNYLGGVDYDDFVFQFCLSELNKLKVSISDSTKRELIYECERAKIELNNSKVTTIIIRNIESQEGNLLDIQIPLTKEKFEAITSQLNLNIFDILLKISVQYNIKSILICGQAGKIFTVQNIIKYLFPNIPIIDLYAENAVIKGLVKYTAVLQGKLDDVLLLDTLKEVIAIKCLKPTVETKDGIISTNEIDNQQFSHIFEQDVTIPTRSGSKFQLVNKEKSDSMWLEFFEIERSSNKYEFLGKYLLAGMSKAKMLYLTVDIFTNSTIELLIESDCSFSPTRIRINNFHLAYQNSVNKKLQLTSAGHYSG